MFDESAFRQLLTREANRSSRYQEFFVLCLVKPDVPDPARESLLEAVASHLVRVLRASDVVGRIQGVIGILLINTPPAEAVGIAERVRAQMSTLALPGHAGGSVTVSVGVAFFPHDGITPARLVSEGQAHLDRAIRDGGNRVVPGRADEA